MEYNRIGYVLFFCIIMNHSVIPGSY